ncbi:hypothetical protein MTO96_024748 [Rhipicephalus appendiculatus]
MLVYSSKANSTAFKKHFDSLLRQQGAAVITMKDAYHELRTIAEEHYDKYSKQIAFGGVFSDSVIELWYSPYSPVSKAVGLNLITTALNQVYSGDATARIVTTLNIYNKTRSHESWHSAVVPELARNWVFWSLVPAAGFGFLAAAFTIQPSSERLSGVVALFFLTGISRPFLLCSDLTFDFLFCAVPMSACLGLYTWFFKPDKFTTVSDGGGRAVRAKALVRHALVSSNVFIMVEIACMNTVESLQAAFEVGLVTSGVDLGVAWAAVCAVKSKGA